MADQIAAFVTGVQQGVFAGGARTPTGGAGAIAVAGCTFGVTRPVDAATGMATGRRTYEPAVITKQIDVSSPQFLAALVNNEVLTQVDLQFFTTTSDGQTVLLYRILLEDAHVVSQRQFAGVSLPVAMSAADAGDLFEEIAFRFGKVTMTFGISTTADAAGGNR